MPDTDPSAHQAPTPGGHTGRFPGFDATAQQRHWDPATAKVVLARLHPPNTPLRFFSAHQATVASALLDRLLDQSSEPRVPVLHMVDERLAAGEGDGWRYADMPHDGQAWQASTTGLDDDAHARWSTGFADLHTDRQDQVIQHVQNLGSHPWHNLTASHVWNLWTRYACTAFWSHPWAWNEMGFGGPAYPRGYLRLGTNTREPWEVQDADPHDPVAQRPRTEDDLP